MTDELEFKGKCNSCNEASPYIYDYDCKAQLCIECWLEEEHSEEQGYHYYVRDVKGTKIPEWSAS